MKKSLFKKFEKKVGKALLSSKRPSVKRIKIKEIRYARPKPEPLRAIDVWNQNDKFFR